MSKIAIDCRMSDSGGIGTFLKSIVHEFVKDKDDAYLLIGDSEKLKEFEGDNVEILQCDIPIFSVKEMFSFPVKEINRCDLFFSPNYNLPGGIKVPVFSTIHDVIYLDLPQLTSRVGRIIRKAFVSRALKKSKGIFTVSEFSKSRINHHFRRTPPLTVCYNGIKPMFAQAESGLSKDGGYFLYLGNVKPHKGLPTLLEAYRMALAKGCDRRLVIVGEYNSFKTGAEDLLRAVDDKKDSITFTGKISDKDLLDVIINATALVQPSDYEGFGIPPLEAMSVGTPCIVSDIPVFKELYADFPVMFFPVNDAHALSDLLLKDYPRVALDESHKNRYSYRTAAGIIKNTIKNSMS